ncbi:MAG: hypothetical protein U1D55_16285 [Phycisphaerae bacterium]
MFRSASVLVFSAAWLSLAASADDRRSSGDHQPLREARSENGRFSLLIEPGRGKLTAAATQPTRGGASARLIEGRPGSADARPIWRGPLVNPVAPRIAVIRDDGEYVVTLDDFRIGGARNALVIYGDDGRLLKQLSLRDLLRAADWREVRARGKSIEWLQGARFEFTTSPEQFVVRLRWGRRLAIDLTRLEVADAADSGDTARIPPEIAALLDGDASDQRDDATNAGAALELSDEDAQRLAQIIQGMGLDLSPEEIAFLEQLGVMRDAVAEMISGDESDDAVSGENAGATTAPAVADATEIQVDRAGHWALNWDVRAESAGDSPSVGLPVPPPPNAKDRTDYIAWVNQTMGEHNEGAAAIQSAISNVVSFSGDEELFNRASSGDPQALHSPEMQQWLIANSDALSQLRAATDLPYHGMPAVSEDGELIAILLPHLAPLRELAKANVLTGRQLASDGRPQDAIDRMLDTARSGAQTSQGYTLIEKLVGVAVQRLASDAILDTIASDSSGTLDYAATAKQIESRYGPTRPMAEHIQYERAMVLDSLQRMYHYDEELGQYAVDPAAFSKFTSLTSSPESTAQSLLAVYSLATTGFDEQVRRVNQHYDELTRGTSLPFPEGRQVMSGLDRQLESPEFRATNPLLSMMLPALSRAHQLSTASETARRATQLVAELKAYQQRTGSLPDSLDVLGERPSAIDPFTGQHLVYRRNGSDFTLYSVGVNGTDEGGVEGGTRDNDMVFWPRPAKN